MPRFNIALDDAELFRVVATHPPIGTYKPNGYDVVHGPFATLVAARGVANVLEASAPEARVRVEATLVEWVTLPSAELDR